jgi:hypothetical protein
MLADQAMISGWLAQTSRQALAAPCVAPTAARAHRAHRGTQNFEARPNIHTRRPTAAARQGRPLTLFLSFR